jgi:hypothetical protein
VDRRTASIPSSRPLLDFDLLTGFIASKRAASMSEKSKIQQIFASYSDCEFLSGEAVTDDEGNDVQPVSWLYENRFDDFLDEVSYALVEGGVSRDTLMRVYLRHALRVLNDEPDSLHAGSDDNRNAIKIIDELMRQRNSDEFLREKVSKISRGLPMPLGLQHRNYEE